MQLRGGEMEKMLSGHSLSGSVPFRRQITFALTRIALMYFDVN